jgi:malate dehydrogenase (quinone)
MEDPKKAISIAESFEVSRQFWSYLVEQKRFLRKNLSKVFRISALFGVKNVEYLKKRFEASKKPTFKDMVFSTDVSQLKDGCR